MLSVSCCLHMIHGAIFMKASLFEFDQEKDDNFSVCGSCYVLVKVFVVVTGKWEASWDSWIGEHWILCCQKT